MNSRKILPHAAVGIVAIFLSLSVSACSTDMLWAKSGGTDDQFAADSKECYAKTHPIDPPLRTETWHFPVYQSCMVARGYTLMGHSAQIGPQTSHFAGS
jgi:hypothetical protein